MTEKGEYV